MAVLVVKPCASLDDSIPDFGIPGGSSKVPAVGNPPIKGESRRFE